MAIFGKWGSLDVSIVSGRYTCMCMNGNLDWGGRNRKKTQRKHVCVCVCVCERGGTRMKRVAEVEAAVGETEEVPSKRPKTGHASSSAGSQQQLMAVCVCVCPTHAALGSVYCCCCSVWHALLGRCAVLSLWCVCVLSALSCVSLSSACDFLMALAGSVWACTPVV